MHVAVLVRARARVVGRDLQEGADRVASIVDGRPVGRGHLAALLLEVGDRELRRLRQAAIAALLALRARARPPAVDEQRVRLGVVADDAREHAHGDVVERARAQRELRRVIVHIVARVHLVDACEVSGRVAARRRRANAHRRHSEARGAERAGEADDHVALRRRDRLDRRDVRHIVGVTGMRVDARHCRQLRSRQCAHELDARRVGRVAPVAVVAAVDANDDAQRLVWCDAPRQQSKQRLYLCWVVDHHREALEPRMQGHYVLHLVGRERHSVENVVPTAIGEERGLGKRRDRDTPPGAAGGNRRAFKRLHCFEVWP